MRPRYDLGLFLALGALGGAGFGPCFCVPHDTAKLVSPVRIFGIPLALLLGWWFFAEAPLERLFPGVFAIVAGGLVIIWRQAKFKKDMATIVNRGRRLRGWNYNACAAVL